MEDTFWMIPIVVLNPLPLPLKNGSLDLQHRKRMSWKGWNVWKKFKIWLSKRKKNMWLNLWILNYLSGIISKCCNVVLPLHSAPEDLRGSFGPPQALWCTVQRQNKEKFDVMFTKINYVKVKKSTMWFSQKMSNIKVKKKFFSHRWRFYIIVFKSLRISSH